VALFIPETHYLSGTNLGKQCLVFLVMCLVISLYKDENKMDYLSR